MSEVLLAFDKMIEPGDMAFFFFTGHGFEIRGQNYLLPTDVPAAGEGQEELIRDAAFPADRIIERLQARGARTAVLVLDACRNNPFERPGARGVAGTAGLAPMTPVEGVFFLFSAGAKQRALDGLSKNDPNPNSVFTRNFARHRPTPGNCSGHALTAPMTADPRSASQIVLQICEYDDPIVVGLEFDLVPQHLALQRYRAS